MTFLKETSAMEYIYQLASSGIPGYFYNYTSGSKLIS